jgi:hypothetical protein
MLCEVTYDLAEDPMMPRCTEAAQLDLPVLYPGQILLQRIEIDWTAWARAWEPDPLGLRGDAVRTALGNVRILPRK